MMNTFRGRIGLLSIVWALSFCALASATPITYHIHVDTLAFQGTTGNLEFVLNPGPNSPVDFATATFFSFTSDGGPFAPAAGDTGDISGGLPGPLTLDNGGPGADHAESFTFGSFFDVFVTLDVPLITPGANPGSTLDLNVEDDQFVPLFTSLTDPLIEVILDAQGNQTLIINNSQVADAETVPEPATLMLLGSGLLMAGLRRFRR